MTSNRNNRPGAGLLEQMETVTYDSSTFTLESLTRFIEELQVRNREDWYRRQEEMMFFGMTRYKIENDARNRFLAKEKCENNF